MRRITTTIVVAGLLAGSASSAAVAAGPAPTKVTVYKTCTAMNQGKYPHGVGRTGAKDRGAGRPVTTFTRDNQAYKLHSTSASMGGYRDLDRDNDGIACEKL